MIDNYEALSVGRYEALIHACDEFGENDTNGRNLAILSILSDTPTDALLDMKVPEFRALMNRCAFLRRAPRPAEVAKVYQLEEWRLLPTLDVRNMTAAQYIDFQTFAARDGEMIAELLSCFLVPDGFSYNKGYDIVKVQEAIRNSLPITAALGLVGFFAKRSRESTLSILRSSAATLKRAKRRKGARRAEIVSALMQVELAATLARAGAGWQMWTPLLK